MCDVIKFKTPFERIKYFNKSPDVALYKAIITQAIIDASNTSDRRKAKIAELEAKKWLFGNSEYFQEVCLCAEIDHKLVVELAKTAIKLSANGSKTIRSKNRLQIMHQYKSN